MEEWYVEKILSKRKKGVFVEYLVEWKNMYEEDETSWVSADDLEMTLNAFEEITKFEKRKREQKKVKAKGPEKSPASGLREARKPSSGINAEYGEGILSSNCRWRSGMSRKFSLNERKGSLLSIWSNGKICMKKTRPRGFRQMIWR
eukprot:TRINITY_DN9405_c0_g1_i1.p1 TRINITY_DN9405_c0_g1~~TRINITY_DN9405_c0_g1_i1.p1  ORF type:complete len:146 (-),score=31.22 TRINITY_DN9405_c0_g1_i1:243-680(-)